MFQTLHGIPGYEEMNQIWSTLYLGSYEATQNLPELQKHNIRTILTVMHTEIPADKRHPTVKYHYIPAHDIESQDLLTRFPEAYAIIDAAVTAKTGILVHCAAGISRSATTVISYLMKKLGKTATAAHDLCQRKRTIIGPNDSFLIQLRLYEKMGCRLDANHLPFRQYLFNICDHFDNYAQFFERLAVAERSTSYLNLGQKFGCVGCGQELFRELHVLHNDGSQRYQELPECGKVFVEPQRWMSGQFAAYDRALSVVVIKCPKCDRPVAKFYTPTGTEVTPIGCLCRNHLDTKNLDIQMLPDAYKLLS
ncbi:unnamed protein product [Medioppia subpectinata]|uniref:protein-tyrosine-phosphatase n=1 Tax=Medioppia subpectinata TaxID=1979941 RepID=A0A7R9PTT6_9ACAR|nr:unnamed protein product [Medioppia subpectinata]CAG2100479.1 unnamed protein product [Medioppia subpectinata]